MTGAVSRRALLGGVAGAGLVAGIAGFGAAVERGALPGRGRAYDLLGLNGPDTVPLPPVEPGPLVSGSFASARRGRPTAWSIAYPPGFAPGAELPVVVALHGRGDDHSSVFGDGIGLDRFLAVTPRPPLAIASVDGGESYWHRRVSGEDAGAMVVEEFLPLLARRGLRSRTSDRIGFYGYSMGGFGALRLAGVLGPGRVAAVVAAGPALWTQVDDASPGAFDSADDFAATTPLGRQSQLDGIAVRVDCGRGDTFSLVTRDYRADFPRGSEPAGGITTGGHTVAYWRSVAADELAFLAAAL